VGGWLYLLLACIAAGSLAYMVAIYLKVYKGITLKGLLRMLGYEDEELRETARVIRELAEYLGFEVRDLVRLLELVKKADRADTVFSMGDVEVRLYKYWERITLSTSKSRGGIRRIIEYDLTPVEALTRMLESLGEG